MISMTTAIQWTRTPGGVITDPEVQALRDRNQVSARRSLEGGIDWSSSREGRFPSPVCEISEYRSTLSDWDRPGPRSTVRTWTVLDSSGEVIAVRDSITRVRELLARLRMDVTIQVRENDMTVSIHSVPAGR